jgi:undecaprenyl-diphosphatase
MIIYLKALLLSIVEGITEFLPISSTGHMILVDYLIKMSDNKEFTSAFEIIIQLGAILSVVVYFWDKIWILNKDKKLDKDKISLWSKVIVAVLPAVVLGLKFDDMIEARFFNATTVAAMLLLYGIILLIIEIINRDKTSFSVENSSLITYKTALIIGFFQTLAMVPGTSRSAATIIGGMLLGLSRAVAAEFSFFLAIPTMAGATLLKIVKSGHTFSSTEWGVIAFGFVVSFIVALAIIKWFMGYITKHDFKIFAYYRIILGIIVLIALR